MLQVALRGSQGLHMLSGGPSFDDVDAESRSAFARDASPNCRAMAFSPDGSKFAWASGSEGVHVARWSQDRRWVVSCTLASSRKTATLRFSPKGTFLCTWEVYAKPSSADFPDTNARVWDAETGEQVRGYVHRKSEAWWPQWTDDEGFCALRSPNNEVLFFSSDLFRQGGPSLPHRLSAKGLDSFSLSPMAIDGGGPLVACYLPGGQKGGPGFAKLFAYPRLSDAVASKSFMTADAAEVMWCPADGRSCLVLATTDVDKTGASYYGKTQLHFANAADGDTAAVQLAKEGPVYSVAWRPTSAKPPLFVVVYGYMPARATLFNKKCDPVFDLGTGPRNMALFNPGVGNLVLVGGFGNLRGNIEVWDVEGKKRVSQFEAADSTDLKWSPDGQHIVTSTCAPRLRTGNGFKVWHYTSTLLHETVLVNTKGANNDKAADEEKPAAIAAPTCDELWEVLWRPVPEGTFPQEFPVLDKPVAGGLALKKPQASKQAYRPPGARGKPSTAAAAAASADPSIPTASGGAYRPVRVPVGLTVATTAKQPDGELSKSATKNRKRNKKKNKAEEGEDQQQQQNGGLRKPLQAAGAPLDDEKAKMARKLQKKIDDIEKLKDRLAKGETLEANQLEKVQKEPELVAQLQKLQV